MYAVSRAYKQMMGRDLRERSFVWVYLGLINRDAQNNAYIDSLLADFADSDVFESSQFEAYYATGEKDFSRIDNTMYFMPRDKMYALKQGAVSKNVLGSITFRFKEAVGTVGGLTIDFGEYYPTRLSISDGNETYEFENNKSLFITNKEFDGPESITVTALEMVGGDKCLRIHSIIFGVGFSFDNKNLISTSRKNIVHHLSEVLPEKSFTFTIDNRNQLFTQDNPDSYAQFLEEQQRVEFTYGRELSDGTIYKIPGGVTALRSWSSNATEAKFESVGYLDYSTSTYYKGKYYEDGITLYDLAVDVFEDAGISYKIDPYLKDITTKNPLPIDLHKNCLQMIANAAESILYEDRNGRVVIKASFTPEREIAVEGAAAFSNIPLLTKGKTVDYATGEKDYTRIDGSMVFIARIDAPQGTGFVSSVNDEAKVIVTFEMEWTFYGMELEFGSSHPDTVTIAEYLDDVLVKTTTFSIDSDSFMTDHEFDGIDKVVITFDGVPDGQKIHLNKVRVGAETDYEIKNHDMNEFPTASSTDKIKNINVKYLEYAYGSELKEIATATVAEDENLITFSTAYHGYEVEYSDGNGAPEVVESGAYYIVFTGEEGKTVSIKGIEFIVSERYFLLNVRQKGQDLTLGNEIVSDYARAKRLAAWFKEYYENDSEYDITYRGEPALDCDDQVYLENRFVDENLIRITEEQLDTSTGMSMTNKIRARRVSYG